MEQGMLPTSDTINESTKKANNSGTATAQMLCDISTKNSSQKTEKFPQTRRMEEEQIYRRAHMEIT
jgi:hypothetical protein